MFELTMYFYYNVVFLLQVIVVFRSGRLRWIGHVERTKNDELILVYIVM